MKLKVNLFQNPKKEKPSKTEYGKIQKVICNEENIKELDLDTFVDLVGKQGAIWKSSFMIGGAKNENFSCAYLLSLDFDNGLYIKDFLSDSKDLGLEPTFIYETYSSTDEFNRFRAIWILKEKIDNPQLKNTLQLMLMEVFSDCDDACKDLSRLWVGGKNISFYRPQNTLDIENLLSATVNSIYLRYGENGAKELKKFCKRIGINIYNKLPFIIKVSNLEGNCPKPYNIFYREMDKNLPKMKFLKYDNFEFSFIDSYDLTKNSNKSSKIQTLKGEKITRITIDFNSLTSKCSLFGDFLNGETLKHQEIKHISFNLYDCKNYPSLLKDTLVKYNYNNWENKYNTYVSAVNYNYIPTNCNNYCKYYSECSNPTNIKVKYYQKENKAKKIGDIETITLNEAEKLLSEVPSLIKRLNKDDFLMLQAPVGLGKSEMLRKIDLTNTMIGVKNHVLGEELFDRLSDLNLDMLYVKPLNMDKMPPNLREMIKSYYDLGIYQEVKNTVFDELKRLNGLNERPEYYFDLKFYVEQLEQIKDATTLLFTHHRISLNNNINKKIDTIILDEDFLNSFINYDMFNKDELFDDLRNLRYWLKRFENTKYKKDFEELTNYFEAFSLELSISTDKWTKNILKELTLKPNLRKLIIEYIKQNSDKLSTNLFKLLGAEAISLTSNGLIHIINGEALKSLENYKIICMSATLDENIHTKFINKYLENKNIIFKSIINTELTGKIYCDCSYSWSREALKNLTKKSKMKLDEILNDDRFSNIITFKSNDVIDLKDTNKVKIAYFGACEGIDKYKGENLCVLGTPHNNSKVYEGYYFLLTEKNPLSNAWKVKRVQKYGFEFDLNTYENEADNILTEIQLYFVYSDLIQAVGRARALRTKANVYVYSSLPLPNSILI